MEKHLQAIQAEYEQLRVKAENDRREAEAEIARLQSVIDASEGMDALMVYQEHAAAAGITLHEWIRMKLTLAIKFNNIPVTRKLYQRFVQLAGNRGTSLVNVTQTEAVEKVLMAAIENQII